jgi:NAD(P)-dependent dehydrogenase (short-subunit alcohol dehydrogenase family)
MTDQADLDGADAPDMHTAVSSLAGKRVLVTGGTTGIGRAIAALLGSYGARLFIFGRHEPELRVALEHIRSSGAEATGIAADTSKPEDVARVFAEADKALGGLDILIANAAVSAEGLTKESEENWRYVMESNVLGYMACAKAAVERMQREGQGHIVVVGSISSDATGPGTVYSTSKAANRGFSKSLREELAEKNIRVSLVEPGSVGSDLRPGEKPEEQRPKIKSGEMLRAEDIAVGVHYILTQPERCTVTEVRIEPRIQN